MRLERGDVLSQNEVSKTVTEIKLKLTEGKSAKYVEYSVLWGTKF
jgi:hypothetical protein